MVAHVAPGRSYSAPIEFVLRLLATNKGERLELAPVKGDGVLIFDHTDERSLPIALDFYDTVISDHVRSHDRVFKGEPMVRCVNGEVDHLATIFYMVNSLQEHDAPDGEKDAIGRFRYDGSYQYRYDVVLENLVQS